MEDHENRMPHLEEGAMNCKRPRISYDSTIMAIQHVEGAVAAGASQHHEETSNTMAAFYQPQAMVNTHDQSIMVAIPPPMNEESLRRELGRVEVEHHHHQGQLPERFGNPQFPEIMNHPQQQQQQLFRHSPIQPNLSPPRDFVPQKSSTKRKREHTSNTINNNKRTLPPHLIILYQELKDHSGQVTQNDQDTLEAQQQLEEAQRRLDACKHQAAALDQSKLHLDHQLLEAELQLDNDFTHHYRQLVQFQKQFGHCNVSCRPVGGNHTVQQQHSYKDLAAWVKKIRRVKQMRASSKGDYYQGTPWNYYIAALDKLGFVWDAVKDQWRNQFDKMMAFKATIGHCAVPKAYAPDKSLGAWVHRQRYHYKLNHEGKPTQLTRDRIDLLNSVGFSWGSEAVKSDRLPKPAKPRNGKPVRTSEEEWEYKYQQLVAFQQHYGHVKISTVDDKNRNNQLRDWVAWQRREYKLWKRGEPSHVTSEHVQRLSEIGFDWELVGSRKGIKKVNYDNNDNNNNIYETKPGGVTMHGFSPMVGTGTMSVAGDPTQQAIQPYAAAPTTTMGYTNSHGETHRQGYHHNIQIDPFQAGTVGPNTGVGGDIEQRHLPGPGAPSERNTNGGISALS